MTLINATPGGGRMEEGKGVGAASQGSAGAPRLTTPDHEAGYRFLKIGEEIRDYDEVWAFGSGPWEKVSCAGERYQKSMDHHPMRRACFWAAVPGVPRTEGEGAYSELIAEAAKEARIQYERGNDLLQRMVDALRALSKAEAP